MPRRFESLSFYLSANDCPIDGEGSGVVMVGGWGDLYSSLRDQTVAGRALVISPGAESCIDSTAMCEALLETLHAGKAPALIVLNRPDDTIALAAVVAEQALSLSLAVVVLDGARFAMASSARIITLHRGRQLVLSGPRLAGIASVTGGGELGHELPPTLAANDGFTLSPEDQRDLDGVSGPAVQVALRIVLRMARLRGAAALIDATAVTIADVTDTGAAGVAIAERLIDWGGKVRVPTTIRSRDRTPASRRFFEACEVLGVRAEDDVEATSEREVFARPLALCVAVCGRTFVPLDG